MTDQRKSKLLLDCVEHMLSTHSPSTPTPAEREQMTELSELQLELTQLVYDPAAVDSSSTPWKRRFGSPAGV